MKYFCNIFDTLIKREKPHILSIAMHCLDICHSKYIIQMGTEDNTLRPLLVRKEILWNGLEDNKCLCSSSGQIPI